MLFDVYKIFRQERVTVTGVIHVGGHHAEEYDGYVNYGIGDMVFFEPSKVSYSIMENKIGTGKIGRVILGVMLSISRDKY